MESNIYQKKPGSGKAFAGVVILVLGIIFLIRQFDYFFIPDWIFSWPMWLIGIGIYQGYKHNFRNYGWLVTILIGVLFLSDDVFPFINIGHFIWPLILIIIGLWVILGRDKFNKSMKHAFHKEPYPPQPGVASDWDARVETEPVEGAPGAEPASTEQIFGKARYNYGDSHIDSTSVFGSVHKMILSKDFQGGEVINIFGGTELNFTQADINGKVFIDVTQLFGGIKLIVPPHWQVVSDMAAIFAGIDDKRRPGATALNPDKILVLKGTSIFAGVEVRSF
ncbi:LiaF transmembrane domain-containing protein [Mucilaginibacter ginkgonis]|uniref:LiaF transmembrane domain-containing protein n=1 Tax=Mucilaginibacter ginkgonis TaxID=2682091 RepID=A0A6I4HVB0_9SPHI|nr:DUF5668 domain-containing protein [Mucilaginibacter ginkgonis]QQL49861.1 hypothetical protein GO620_017110 [Mucilaginibacter ginkgonis]